MSKDFGNLSPLEREIYMEHRDFSSRAAYAKLIPYPIWGH